MTPWLVIFILILILGLLMLRDESLDQPHDSDLESEVDRLLPQTQCGQCGYEGCRPYASALIDGHADIDQCPPGGDITILKLSRLLGVPLSNRRQTSFHQSKLVAEIDEERCIGCVKCIKACPVDAIVGSAKHMHTVIDQYCTGCELCVTPCPVDCISMISIQTAGGDSRSRMTDTIV